MKESITCIVTYIGSVGAYTILDHRTPLTLHQGKHGAERHRKKQNDESDFQNRLNQWD